MKIAIFGNNYKEENLCLLKTLFDVMKRKNVDICIEESFFQFMTEHLDFTPDCESLIVNDQFSADMAVSIGGDGTFLKTAAQVGQKGIPIIGINTGRLGFLADISSTDIIEPFESILNGEYIIEERSVLQLNCNHCAHFSSQNIALNEVSVMKQDSSSMITISAYIDNQPLISYQADGLIVATPTGSTAYSMSVGGPLVVPTVKGIILTPIASHSLTVRPLIITDDCEIRLKVDSRTKSFLASIDGRSQVFDQSIELTIKKADFNIKVVKQKNHNFFNTLRNKLMWGADKRDI